MRRIAWMLCAVLPATSLFATLPARAADAPPRLVAVNGDGEVSVKPDRARLNLAADALNADLKTAESQVNAIVRAYLAEAKALGSKDEQISTAGISINPEYVWDDKLRQQKLVGYRARRDIEVVITDLDKLGDYVLRATKAGVNHVSPPQLESSRSDELQRQALAKAAQDAQSRARLLADTLNVKLGSVRSIRANEAVAPPRPIAYKTMAMAEAADAGSGNEQLGFSGGEIKYSASVSAEFDLIER
ncbi:SIMPL domain-containing protein [Solimonas soli]|uniref:SIMPL domain-containing protein n=1 Tax=Solimonas soli TaxID=413479 RepID=UPI0004850532|nr:SIMPL domain-containing protein [Solimonas soli]